MACPGHHTTAVPRRRSRSWLATLAMTTAVAAVVSGGGCSGGSATGDRSRSTATTEASPPAPGEEDGSQERVPHHRYVSRPDLTPPVVHIVTPGGSPTDLLCLAPKRHGAQAGPLIVDRHGEPVWVSPAPGGETAADLRVQTYRGQPVLTWWEGRSAAGRGSGEAVMVDRRYREVARLRVGGGADFHELRLTDEGTALLLVYRVEPADLSSAGGPTDGYEHENLVREVDVATGKVLFEWRAGDHVPVTDTYSRPRGREDGSTEEGAFDWFHANSVAPGPDGTLLVSARNTHAVYAVDRRTGDVRWTMGGKRSDIDMGPGASFAWQHDAQWLGGSRFSLFDNHASTAGGDPSRALVLDVDTRARTARLVSAARHPASLSAGTQGNAQVLPGHGLFVGWGSAGRMTEFAPDGTVTFDASFAPADSYRAYRCDWSGRPGGPPDVVARSVDAPEGEGRAVEVAASWNGATGIASWRVLAGEDEEHLETVAEVRRDGFETVTTLARDADAVAVEALAGSGAVLARSDTVAVG